MTNKKTPPTEAEAIEAAQYLAKAFRGEVAPDARALRAAVATVNAYTRHRAAEAARMRAITKLVEWSQAHPGLWRVYSPVRGRVYVVAPGATDLSHHGLARVLHPVFESGPEVWEGRGTPAQVRAFMSEPRPNGPIH